MNLSLRRVYIRIDLLIVGLAAACIFAAGAQASMDREAARKAVTAAQWAEGARVHDYALVDQDGKAFRLSEYFGGGKPLVVGFIYTSCDSTCPETTASLINAIKEVRNALGDSFNALTIDFSAQGAPDVLKEYAGRFSPAAPMRFATGTRDDIEGLTKEFGFYYRKNGHGFDHLNMVSVLTPDGRIYRQAFGVRISPERIKKPIEELLTGDIPAEKPPTVMESLKAFCSVADPLGGGYVLNYPVIAGMAFQALIIAAVLYAAALKPLKAFIGHEIGRRWAYHGRKDI